MPRKRSRNPENSDKKRVSLYARERVNKVLEKDKNERIEEQVRETRARVGGVFGRLRRFFGWRPILGEGGVKDVPIYAEEKVTLAVGRMITNPVRKVMQIAGKLVFGVLGFAYGASKSGAKEAGQFSAKLGNVDSVNKNPPGKIVQMHPDHDEYSDAA